MGIVEERNRRKGLWNRIIQLYNGTRIQPNFLRDLRLYGGAAGIYQDKQNTGRHSNDGNGIAVSILHTGKSYPDDLFEDGIIYHYPDTNRGKSFDEGEINSVKKCREYDIPLFVISHSENNTSLRDVRLGWVEMWYDNAKEFLISFSKQDNQSEQSLLNDSTFSAFDKTKTKKTTKISVRINQGRFRLSVLNRYGCECAVCYVKNAKLLDAAHLVGKSNNGSDDPRNGIVLCKNHHAAFDKGLFYINPISLELVFVDTSASDLMITKNDISHLKMKPHSLALEHRWKEFKAKKN